MTNRTNTNNKLTKKGTLKKCIRKQKVAKYATDKVSDGIQKFLKEQLIEKVAIRAPSSEHEPIKDKLEVLISQVTTATHNVLDSTDKYYTINFIEDYAVHKYGKRYYPMYLVHWTGYSKPTWEFDYQLRNTSAVDDYWEMAREEKWHPDFWDIKYIDHTD